MDIKRRNYEKVYDITVMLGVEQIDAPIPGVKPFSRDLVFKMEDDGAFELSNLSLSSHAGTHIDAPSHFIPEAKSIDEYSVEDFILPAHVVHVEDKESVKPFLLKDIEIQKGDAVLFKTNNSMSGICRNGQLSENYVYISSETADLCIEKEVGLIGIDYLAPEKPGGRIEEAPIHRKLLGNNILILEGINLKGISPGKYTLFCLPLKIRCGEASPVRAILIS